MGFSLLCCVIAALPVYQSVRTTRALTASSSDFRQPKTETRAADSSAHGKAIAEKSPLTTPTAAQQSSDWETCLPASYNKPDPAIDVRISACMRILEQGDRESVKNRMMAYSNRCSAYRRKGDLDRAIADCTEAIRLDPEAALRLRSARLRGSNLTGAVRWITFCHVGLRGEGSTPVPLPPPDWLKPGSLHAI